MIITGIFVNGPYAIITTAVSADLVSLHRSIIILLLLCACFLIFRCSIYCTNVITPKLLYSYIVLLLAIVCILTYTYIGYTQVTTEQSKGKGYCNCYH